MQRILSTELSAHTGETVTVAGWVHRRRLLKSVAFLIVRDAAGLSQVVVTDDATRAQVETLGEETVVEVTATATANTAAPAGVELTSPQVRVHSSVAVPLPVELHRPTMSATLPTQLDHAAVSLRHPRRSAALRISAAAVAGFRAALDERRFVEVHTPKIVGSATESGANVFALDWFGRPAFLAQSPQFFKQTMVGVFERVYEVGPVFRAEPHDTARHLAQYTSLDAELGFVADHRDVMAVLTAVLARMLATVTERAGASVDLLGAILPRLPDEVPAVHFADALTIAGAPADEPDLAPAHERALGEWRCASTGPTSSSSPDTRWRSGRSTPTPTPRGPAVRTASTCCSAGWNWSPGGSGCTGTRTTSRRSRPGVSHSPRTRATWRRSPTGCPRTAASRSASSASWPGWWGRRTCARSLRSRGTCTG